MEAAGGESRQQSIRIVCSTAMTMIPSMMWSWTFFGSHTLTLRPPCASSRWLSPRSANSANARQNVDGDGTGRVHPKGRAAFRLVKCHPVFSCRYYTI